MWTVKSNYDKNGKLSYTSSPYKRAELSDGGDDDLCVWDYNYDSDDAERLAIDGKPSGTANHHIDHHPLPTAEARLLPPKTNPTPRRLLEHNDTHCKPASSTHRPAMQPQPHADDDEDVEWEEKEALESALQSLGVLSKYMLKLEVRAGKTTKEAIRQTLDDTANEYTANLPGQELSHQELVKRIARSCDETARRMLLVDRHFVRQCSRMQSDQPLSLLSESGVKSWLKVETRDSQISNQDPCYFTVHDLVAGRRFSDWIGYLRGTCGFRPTEGDDAKLLNLAWRFLDRDLRGSVPLPSARVDDFVSELENKHRNGDFEAALQDPRKQARADEKSWRNIRKVWSGRAKRQ